MVRKVGGFALLSRISDQADPFHIIGPGALVPVDIKNEYAWVVARMQVPPGVTPNGLMQTWVMNPAHEDYNRHKDECLILEQSLGILCLLAQWKGLPQDDLSAVEMMVSGLLKTQAPSGEFPVSVNRFTGIPFADTYRTFVQAWVIYTLVLYCLLLPKGANVTKARDALVQAKTALLKYQVSPTSPTPQKGLITTGRGTLQDKFTSDDLDLPQAILEDNVMSWFALQAYQVLLGMSMVQFDLLTQNIPNFWDISTFRYWMAPEGLDKVKDTSTTHMYGGLWCLATKDPYRANMCLFNLNPYKFFLKVPGITPVLPDRGWPGAEKNVWASGTFEYALLMRRLQGDSQADLTVSAIGPLRDETGGWWNTIDLNPGHTSVIGEWPSVRNTAWAVLTLHKDTRTLLLSPLSTPSMDTSKFVEPGFVDPDFVE